MDDNNSGNRQENFFDTCSKCKTNYSCCHETLPPITETRRRIIEDYIKTNKISIPDPFCTTGYTFPRIDTKGYCVFHDKTTRKCRIHSIKPETCVSGPITFDINRKTGKIEWFIKMEKICPLAGVVYGNKEQMQKHLDSAKNEITRLVNELNSEALREVLAKDEPETFKIGEDSLGRDVLQKLLSNQTEFH